MRSLLWSLAIGGALVSSAGAQNRPPVIDMHVHTSSIEQLDALNIRYAFLAGTMQELRKWESFDKKRYLPSLMFPCEDNRAPIGGTPCFDTQIESPDVAWLREQLRSGRLKGLGEITAQYMGMSPTDPRLEPYWALAEEFDVPVAIHMGPGPPPGGSFAPPPPYLMAMGDPLLLEDVLHRHRKLRLFVMHAGWPRLDSILALLWNYANVYVDVGALQGRAIPREGYYRYLRDLVEAGFANRVMFGSDLPPLVEQGIDAIVQAPFLTEQQKGDILCNNAARFLRLETDVCKP